ncbi:hypothetical protein CI109_105162 [Kwoniella shandongensis]|uniref:Uncharacterized protein n=1 Tax=Kwoniella shandongensis TaxID=1734106 RepID=A0A5M6C379_9TREE|nr:uncharacterized protein CI109_002001 [Kwoniella shandongensis]KAA5529576.1 hypothetical protein CI109_002001 [Kwoniella shandongensis]
MADHAEPPAEPAIETTVDTIASYPEARESDGIQLPPSDLAGDDVPGPSTTYIPRQPSPPLPNLKPRPFPLSERIARDEGSDDDEDDEVLATLPMYLSSTLHSNLDIYQYPLQHRSISVPKWAQDRGKIITSRVKEKAGRVEVEIPVDAGTSYWREDRARDLGFVMNVNENGGENGDVVGGYGFSGRGGASGKDKDKKGKEKKKNDEKWGDKMRLRSELVPNSTGYYSGVIREGALHLHPISRLLQFRTALDYLDEADTKQRERSSRRSAANGANGDNSDDDDGPGGAKKKGKAPTAASAAPIKDLRPARKLLDEEENDGSGSIKDFRNKMWWMANREADDEWIPYTWKEGVHDDGVAQALEALVVPEDKRERLTSKTRPLDYLDRT